MDKRHGKGRNSKRQHTEYLAFKWSRNKAQNSGKNRHPQTKRRDEVTDVDFRRNEGWIEERSGRSKTQLTELIGVSLVQELWGAKQRYREKPPTTPKTKLAKNFTPKSSILRSVFDSLSPRTTSTRQSGGRFGTEWVSDESEDTVSHQYDPWFPCHKFLGCLTILELLDIEIKWMGKYLVKACVQACHHKPWAEAFLSGRFKQGRDYLLHLALQRSMLEENWEVFDNLWPQVTSQRPRLCVFKKGIKSSTLSVTKAAKLTYNTGDMQQDLESLLGDCVKWEDWDMVQMLLSSNHDQLRVDTVDIALSSALQHEKWDVVLKAVEKGASRNHVKKALVAALMSKSEWEVVEACTRKGITISHCTDPGLPRNRDCSNLAFPCCEGALDLNSRFGHTIAQAAASDCKWMIVKSLVRSGARPDKADPEGMTVIHRAVAHKEWYTVSSLIPHCRHFVRTMSSCDLTGKSLFHVLCEEGQLDLVRESVSRGVKINHRDQQGSTGMILAAQRSQWDTVRLLLELGANPDLENSLHQNALQVAVVMKNWDMADLVIRHSRRPGKAASSKLYRGNGDTALHLLCEAGQVDLLHMLLLMGADPFVQNKDGETLMVSAMFAETGRDNLLRVLIQSGVSTHQAVHTDQVLHRRGVTLKKLLQVSPMALAVWSGMLKTVNVLHAAGASPNEELHVLERSRVFRERLQQRGHADLLQFLRQVTSEPRRLRDLCVLKVSHLIGCRLGREVRAESTGLPRPLCDLVLLNHVTSLQFPDDTGVDPAAQSTQPRRERFHQGFFSQTGVSLLFSIRSRSPSLLPRLNMADLFDEDFFGMFFLPSSNVFFREFRLRRTFADLFYREREDYVYRYRNGNFDLISRDNYSDLFAKFGLERDTFEPSHFTCTCRVLAPSSPGGSCGPC